MRPCAGGSPRRAHGHEPTQVGKDGFHSALCQGRAIGRITCLQVTDGNNALLSGWLTEASGVFSRGRVVEAILRENDPQTVGPLVGRAGFVVRDGELQCPPFLRGFGPPILSGTIRISQALVP